MLNTSVMDMNSTSAPLNFSNCVEEIYGGMVVFYVVLSLTFFLGTPAHSWFLWLSLRAGWKIKPTQVFLFSKTILELILSFQCGLDMLNLLIFNNDMFWTVAFLADGLCWVGRPLMQICICIEQYLAVLHPIMFLKYKDIQYRIAFAAVIWLLAAACAVCQMCMDTLAYHIFNSIFFISVIVISFCCVSVLRALKNPGPGDTMERGRDVGNQQKRNAFNTILSGLLIILLTYLPQVSLSMFNLLEIDEKSFFCNIVPFISYVAIAGVMISPLMKIYKNGSMKVLTHKSKIRQN